MEWPTPGDPKTMRTGSTTAWSRSTSSLLEVMSFPHLIMHDPSWGYWVPVGFEEVIFPDKSWGWGNSSGRQCG